MHNDGNSDIEQPDVPGKAEGPQKDVHYDPEKFGYKKFNPTEHEKDKAKTSKIQKDKDKEAAARMGEVLRDMNSIDHKNTMGSGEISDLDGKVRLSEEDKKSPKQEQEALKAQEKPAFLELMKTFEVKNKLPIAAEGQTSVFEFKGLVKDGKNTEGPNSKEHQKLVGQIDKGGEVPKNLEFHFQTTFQKGRDQNETVTVNYKVGLHQIMRDGLEKTLQSLLALSYSAAASYDAHGKDKDSKEAPREKPSETADAKIESLKKDLAKNKGTQVATIQDLKNNWGVLQVHMPEKQKQYAIVYDGALFHVKTQETKTFQHPAEVLQYMEKAQQT